MPARRLCVVQLLPALHAGGVERSTLEIGAALVAAGHRSIVISAGGRLLAPLLAQGSEHVTLPIGAKSLLTLRHIWTLKRLFTQLAPDIVHARSRLPAWLGWLAIKRMRAPRPHFVTTVHGLNSPGRYSAIMTRGERVICVSDSVREFVLAHYPQTDATLLRVIPRGIEPLEFPAGYVASAAWQADFFTAWPMLRGAPLLTLPGRGTRLKNHIAAIDLLADLVARGQPARLLLLGAREPGRADYVAEMERHAHTRGVAGLLAITPARADVRDVYAVSDVILQLSSKPESFGRTVIEALSLGRPVVGFAHGGVGELLRELYPAGAVPREDHAALTEAVVRVLKAPPPIAPLRNYRLADMQTATLGVYTELADQPAGRVAA